MKVFTSLFVFIFLLACGSPKTLSPIIESPNTENSETVIIQEEETIERTLPIIPEGAEVGDFNGDTNSFYAFISSIDLKSGKTFISFENNRYPLLKVPKTIGGNLEAVMLEGFNRDLLLFTAQLKDPSFNKYFLFVLKDNSWLPVINGFAIHKSNITEEIKPFKINPNKPDEILRHYSVFDLDKTSPLGYTWRLLQESIPILNK